MHWEWRGKAVNFVHGQATFFEKHIFLMGQENTQKCVPNPFLTHVFHFLTQLKLARAFASCFSAFFLHLSMSGNLFLSCTVNGKRDLRFGAL